MNFFQFNWNELTEAVFFNAGFNYLRYFFMAGFAYYIFFHRPPNCLKHLRISNKKRPLPQNKRDVLYSLLSISIFCVIGILTYFMEQAGLTQIYKDVNDYGWTWWFLSISIMIIIHDTYFYWTHYFMHNKKIYPLFHKVHHISRNPTPLTSYAFHPLEAIIEAGIYPIIVVLFPVHQGALLVFFTIAFGFNILGHLGHEVYPSWLIHSPLGKILNTTTHHHQHHQKFNCNYGYYFNFWDRILKTNHHNYEKTFIKNAKVGTLVRIKIAKSSVKKA